jgi:DNA-binding GntR family transcriptional regulator
VPAKEGKLNVGDEQGEQYASGIQLVYRSLRLVQEVVAILRQSVYQEIKRQVIRCELPPGEPLNERDVASRLGVSRTPLREALLLLTQDGSVIYYPSKGFVVKPITVEDSLDVLELRLCLHLYVIDQLFKRGTFPPVDDLKRILAEGQEALGRCDKTGFLECNIEFDQALVALLGNHLMYHVCSAMEDKLLRLGHFILNKIDSLLDVPGGERHDVVAALEKGDRASAVSALLKHSEGARDRLSGLLRLSSMGKKKRSYEVSSGSGTQL